MRRVINSEPECEAMNAFIERHRLRPVVDAAYPLDRLQDAMRHMDASKHFGKVAVLMPAARSAKM